MKHRIPVTDFADALRPISYVLEIQADTADQAYTIAGPIDDTAQDKLPPGVRVVCMKFEEVLPFLRQGHSARRRSWSPDIVIRTAKFDRLILCERSFQDPSTPHQIIDDWGIGESLGVDIMSDNWELAATPPPRVP